MLKTINILIQSLPVNHKSFQFNFTNILLYDSTSYHASRKGDTRIDEHTLKNLINSGISLADSGEFIFFPCFSDRFCRISFTPTMEVHKKKLKHGGWLTWIYFREIIKHIKMLQRYLQEKMLESNIFVSENCTRESGHV